MVDGRSSRSLSSLCILHFAFCILHFVLAPSCTGAKDRRQELPYALESFNESLRWKQYPTALAWLDPGAGGELSTRLRGAARDLEFSEVELVEMRVLPDGEHAECLIQFSWYDARDLTIRTGYEIQGWRKTENGWVLTWQNPPPDPKTPRSPFVKIQP